MYIDGPEPFRKSKRAKTSGDHKLLINVGFQAAQFFSPVNTQIPGMKKRYSSIYIWKHA